MANFFNYLTAFLEKTTLPAKQMDAMIAIAIITSPVLGAVPAAEI